MNMRIVRRSSIPAEGRRGRKPSALTIRTLSLVSKLRSGQVVEVDFGSEQAARNKSATIYQALRRCRKNGASIWSGVKSSVRGSSLFLWRA